jgi:pilus retraction protein PilT
MLTRGGHHQRDRAARILGARGQLDRPEHGLGAAGIIDRVPACTPQPEAGCGPRRAIGGLRPPEDLGQDVAVTEAPSEQERGGVRLRRLRRALEHPLPRLQRGRGDALALVGVVPGGDRADRCLPRMGAAEQREVTIDLVASSAGQVAEQLSTFDPPTRRRERLAERVGNRERLATLLVALNEQRDGLVLVCGPTGSGKSTTLAAMVQAINRRAKKHVITLEDPIEYVFDSENCLIEQRELGTDMPSFASGLKHALRQDPDIILVGEMRDLETAALAITAAETGHLVLSTLHTVNAAQTVERIVDMYPSGQQNQIRAMLANTLQAVVSQTLFRRIDQEGMVPAVEVLLCNSAVRNIIREARTFEIANVIQTNRAIGMRSLDSSIAELYNNGVISREDALAKAAAPEKFGRTAAAA